MAQVDKSLGQSDLACDGADRSGRSANLVNISLTVDESEKEKLCASGGGEWRIKVGSGPDKSRGIALSQRKRRHSHATCSRLTFEEDSVKQDSRAF